MASSAKMRTFASKTLAPVASWVLAISPNFLVVLFFLADAALAFFFHTQIMDGAVQVWTFLSFVLGSAWSFIASIWTGVF